MNLTRLPATSPCHCGAEAVREHLKRKRLDLDGHALLVRGFPRYGCPSCRTKWIPLQVTKLLRRAVVAGMIHERHLDPSRVRFARKTMGLTQEAFAAALDLKGGKSLFSRYEAGEVQPQGATVQAIGLFIEKWFRERWGLVPVTPFGFEHYSYGVDTEPTSISIDLDSPPFRAVEAATG